MEAEQLQLRKKRLTGGKPEKREGDIPYRKFCRAEKAAIREPGGSYSFGQKKRGRKGLLFFEQMSPITSAHSHWREKFINNYATFMPEKSNFVTIRANAAQTC